MSVANAVALIVTVTSCREFHFTSSSPMQGTVFCNVTVRTVNRDNRHFVVRITFTFPCIMLVATAWGYVSQHLMADVPKVIDVQCSSVFVFTAFKNSSSLRCRIPLAYFYTALNLNSVWVGHNSFFLPFNSFCPSVCHPAGIVCTTNFCISAYVRKVGCVLLPRYGGKLFYQARN